MKYDLCVAAFDSENPLGARKGDIVVARPAGKPWGIKELRQYLIVPDVELTREQLNQLSHIGRGEEDVPERAKKNVAKIDLSLLSSRTTIDTQRMYDMNDQYQPLLESRDQPSHSGLIRDIETDEDIR